MRTRARSSVSWLIRTDRTYGCVTAGNRHCALRTVRPGKEKRPGPRARTPTGRQFVPPYEAFPLRWAGVSLLIVGLTSSLVSHLNGSDPAPGVEKHEERSTRSVECQGCGLGPVEPHPKTPCTFHDSSLRARTAEPGRHR